MRKEIAIISGKGGTGKTTLALSIIPYFEETVIADCDVDAPDMNILLNQSIEAKTDFIGFQRPVIDTDKCTHCGLCHASCKFGAIDEFIHVLDGNCEGCNVCAYVCPVDAIKMVDNKIGELYTRRTAYGPMVDARLIPGEESSGKLVTEVRRLSKIVASKERRDTIIIDGSPGLACNVIATISGVTNVIIVTEPTESGLHDLRRVIKLTEMFHIKIDVVINKYDLNKEKSKEIEEYCSKNGIDVKLHIPFDKKIVESISKLQIPSTTSNLYYKTDEWKSFIKYLKNQKEN